MENEKLLVMEIFEPERANENWDKVIKTLQRMEEIVDKLIENDKKFFEKYKNMICD